MSSGLLLAIISMTHAAESGIRSMCKYLLFLLFLALKVRVLTLCIKQFGHFCFEASSFAILKKQNCVCVAFN